MSLPPPPSTRVVLPAAVLVIAKMSAFVAEPTIRIPWSPVALVKAPPEAAKLTAAGARPVMEPLATTMPRSPQPPESSRMSRLAAPVPASIDTAP